MMIRDTGKMEDIHEAHFYHEDPLPTQIMTPLIYEKENLHLKLQPDHHANTRLEQLRRNNIPTELMNSPDFGFLKLASPDLEKMLLAFQSGGSDSPTGTTHTVVEPPATTTLLKHVDHSKGLAEALQDLHDRQDIRDTATIIPQLTQGTYMEENAATTDQLYLTTDASGSITVASTRDKYQEPSLLGNSFAAAGVTTVPGNDKQLNTSYVVQQFHATNTFLPSTSTAQIFTTPLHHHADDDAAAQLRALAAYNNVLAAPNAAFPSQVFKLNGGAMFGDSCGLQPIDLEMQEMVKRERKKQRNRVASSKCRKRKLEKEAVLETTVKDLKARNMDLSTLANALKQQICDLKQRVMDHVTEGCPITLQHVEDPSELYDEEEWDPLSERT